MVARCFGGSEAVNILSGCSSSSIEGVCDIWKCSEGRTKTSSFVISWGKKIKRNVLYCLLSRVKDAPALSHGYLCGSCEPSVHTRGL